MDAKKETHIQNTRITIEQTRDELNTLEKALYDMCDHPHLLGKYGASTGGYSPHDDEYWVRLHCPTCGKKWTADSEHPDYHREFIRIE